MSAIAHDLAGKKFGRLTVIERYAKNTKQEKPQWICKCDCGNEHIVPSASLVSGDTRSCGCLSKETKRTYKHGMTHSKLYSVWRNMIDRCYREKNHAYKDYGGRGIYVCDEWRNDFKAFYDWAIKAGYGEGLSIDRSDNNGPYSPENCRWETPLEQANNRRANRLITFQGETKSLTQWSREYGHNYAMVQRRLNRGWSVETALTTPSKRKKKA